MDALQGYGDSSGDESVAEEESTSAPTTSKAAASSSTTFSIPTIPAVDSLEAEVGRKEWETREAPAKPIGKGKKKVLITLPSLGNLDSDDEDESAAKKKPRPAQGCTAAPSAAKSRLLSMLPAPSTGPTTPIALPKPLTTHKRIETPKTGTSPAASASATTTTSLLPASLRAKAKKEKKKSGPGQEEAEETVLPADFFGSGPSEQPEIGLPPPTVPFQPLEDEVVDDEYALPAEVDYLETPAAMTAPLNTAADVHPSQAYNCANVVGSSSGTGSIQQGYSDEAAQRLIYRNESEAWGQLRPQGGGNVEIRDVSVADELGPNVRENLLRNLAYRPGQPQQPPSMSDVPGKRKRQKAEDEPSQLARRKHQITFLAHQAKAREEALQQQWALNRASRTQSRNKYGF